MITGQRSIVLDEREHAHEYIYTCQYMHIYTHEQTSSMGEDTKKKKYMNKCEHICIQIYEAVCSYIYQSIYIGVCVCVCVCTVSKSGLKH